MSTQVYFDIDKVEETLHKMCECGHRLYEHGFNDYLEYSTGSHYFVVSICIHGDCKEFKEKAPQS